MSAAFQLAARYVLRHRLQSTLLAGALGLVFALPFCLRVLIDHAQRELRSRAAATPQIIGARGSALDLMMTALYFKRENLTPLPFGTLAELRQNPSAAAIPLHVRFVFVDLKTSWLIEGRSHGHDDLKKDESVVLKQEEHNIVGNAAVRMFNEVTDANIASFHFHGDIAAYPVSAVIVLPQDAKAEALLAGQLTRSKTQQLIRPRDEMESLLAQLVRLEGFAASALLLTATAALLVTALVFALSFRLRQREFATLEDVGVSRRSLFTVKVLEIVFVGLAAVVLGLLLLMLASFAAPHLLRWAL